MRFQEARHDFMIFSETIEFSKKFPTCHPKLFKGFIVWGKGDTEPDGYVVLIANSDLANESYFNQVTDYAKTHKLRIDYNKDYLVICTPG